MDSTKPGPEKFRLWRETQGNRSALAKRLNLSNSMLFEMEHGTRAPGLELALRLDEESSGAVPFDSWGHDPGLIERVQRIARRRAGAVS